MKRSGRIGPMGVALVALAICCAGACGAWAGAVYGIDARVATSAYLHMPRRADGNLPARLSETGAFEAARGFAPAKGMIPYDLIVAFWSDGAIKSRMVAVPEAPIKFSADGEWTFPPGTVFVKTFDLPVDVGNPGLRRRLETRLLVVDESGGVYGVDYKWRADGSDADLLPAGFTEQIPVKAADGQVHEQTWYYPSRQDCLTCHNARAGGVLGLKTRQMNHDFHYPSGVTDNELRTWNHLRLFSPGFDEKDIASFAKLAAADDESRSLQDRLRSYLDANCSHCHQPGGTVANFDARYTTPIERQELIDGPVLIDQGLDKPRVIAPHDIWRSVAYLRVNTTGDIRMPPLARETIDVKGVALMRQWIESLPGRDVLSPPRMQPVGGSYPSPIEVSLTPVEPGADIHYTLDGSAPSASDPKYDKPIKLTNPTVLRARAYKDGFTRSVSAQEVFIVGQ